MSDHRPFFMAMTEFRPCPSHPEYEINIHGVVRRAEKSRTYKTGLTVMVPAKVLKRVGRKLEYVNLRGQWVKAIALIEEAWAVTVEGEDRPVSSYPDGRIITLDEWVQLKRFS